MPTFTTSCAWSQWTCGSSSADCSYLTQDEAFIFIGKTRTTAKILHRESNGLTLYVRKLSEGRFQIPKLNEDKRTCNLDYKNFICLILGEKCVGE